MTEATSESARRKAELLKQLDGAHTQALIWAYANHYMSIWLVVAALGCSIAAGVMGFFTAYSSKVIGGVAVLPALIAYVAVNLKCEGKNSWHARRVDGLDKLRMQLRYEQPETPMLEQIAILSRAKVELEERMQRECDEKLLLTWGRFGHPPRLGGSPGGGSPARRGKKERVS